MWLIIRVERIAPMISEQKKRKKNQMDMFSYISVRGSRSTTNAMNKVIADSSTHSNR